MHSVWRSTEDMPTVPVRELVLAKKSFHSTISWAPINLHQRRKVWHPCFNKWARSNKCCESLFPLWCSYYMSSWTSGQHVLAFAYDLCYIFFKYLLLGFSSHSQDWCILEDMMLHAVWSILAVRVPVVFAFLRLLVSNSAMSWYAHPGWHFLCLCQMILLVYDCQGLSVESH